MKTNEIVVSADFKGKFLEGYLVDGISPKPGQVMQFDFTQPQVGGRFAVKLYSPGSDGARPIGPYLVLLPDHLSGKDAKEAYPANVKSRCFLAIPQAGDELNLLIADVAGTGDSHPIGERLMVANGTGKFIALAGSPHSAPATLLESLPALTEDTLGWCVWNGY